MTKQVISKIIAGPTGFYAFCADRPIAVGDLDTAQRVSLPQTQN
jgi:hypothetical protein